jgi:hypothetical protein
LLSPSVFVLWLLLLIPLILILLLQTHSFFLLYSSILIFVSKPVHFEMLLYTGKFFTDLFSPTFGSFHFKPSPALHLAQLHFRTVSVAANKQTMKGYGNAESMIWNKVKWNINLFC